MISTMAACFGRRDVFIDILQHAAGVLNRVGGRKCITTGTLVYSNAGVVIVLIRFGPKQEDT